jgi:2-polyprenyl-6-hydroxyphenyl methylase/3-demethylubiquinone-9 3-methyltransferase
MTWNMRRDRTNHVQIDFRACNGCGLCVESCPQSVLRQHLGKPHHHVRVENRRNCLGCLRCVRACPRGAIRNVSWWDGLQRFQRLLANEVHPRLVYFNRVNPDWFGLDVLDLGCGCGFMAEAISRLGAIVIGIDPNVASLDSARTHARGQNLGIEYREGFGEAIPLAEKSVDRVVCVDVLEHVEDLRRVLSEVRRVLRPGGLFFFDTINRTLLSRLLTVTIAETLSIIPRGTHDPRKFVRPEELGRLLTEEGFQHVGEFAGIGISRLNRRLDFEFRIVSSTSIMYLGYASS